MTAFFARVVTPKSGHLGDNTKFAKKRLKAIKKYTGVNVELRTRLGGPAGQLLMVSSHKDLSEIEALRRKVMEGVLSGAIPQPPSGIVEKVEDQIWISAD